MKLGCFLHMHGVYFIFLKFEKKYLSNNEENLPITCSSNRWNWNG